VMGCLLNSKGTTLANEPGVNDDDIEETVGLREFLIDEEGRVIREEEGEGDDEYGQNGADAQRHVHLPHGEIQHLELCPGSELLTMGRDLVKPLS